MTGALFEEWLKGVDKQMRRQRRKILLFLDNSPAHPTLHMENVKLAFLPPNTTSVAQPMDQGIIQTMKLHFFKLQSQHILGEVDNSTLCGSALLKQVTILDTIYLISKAWESVQPSTIVKCFRRCGFNDSKGQIEPEGDGFDSENDIPLIELVKASSVFGRNLSERAEEDIPTCRMAETDWERPAKELLHSDSKSDSEPDEHEHEETSKPACTLSEAKEFTKKLSVFARASRDTVILNNVMSITSALNEMDFQKKTHKDK